MASLTPPPVWVKEGKLAAYFHTLLPPAIQFFVNSILIGHLQAIRNTLRTEFQARCGTLGLPPSEMALCDPISAALVARTYGAWWTKSRPSLFHRI